MSFSNTMRNIAVAPEVLDNLFPVLLAEYGEYISDGIRGIITIGAHWDDENHSIKRAASLLDQTITPRKLIDGRVVYTFLPQSDLEQRFLNGEISDIEELTEDEINELIFSHEIP